MSNLRKAVSRREFMRSVGITGAGLGAIVMTAGFASHLEAVTAPFGNLTETGNSKANPKGNGPSGDVVLEWNTALMDMIKADNISNQFGNRALAMMHVAMFDAANGIEERYSRFFVDQKVSGQLPQDAAAASAAYTVLSSLYPAKQSMWQALYADHLAGVATNTPWRNAVRYGEETAQAVLSWRQNDGSAQANIPYLDGTEPGEYRRTGAAPILPGWGNVTPFAMKSGNQFRLNGPPPLDSYEYARDYNEVKEIGRNTSATRTPWQTETARFWPGGIPRMWNLVAHQVIGAGSYDLLETARLFALLNITLADANVMAWDMKYHYGFWRPITAIRQGDLDGNDATIGEAGWNSLLPAPAFPEYVSGHSTACPSAAMILDKFLGSDNFTFTLASEANPSLPPRTWDSFWAAAREAGISRIYGGIPFNFSNVEGLEAGRSLGRYVYENFMTPV